VSENTTQLWTIDGPAKAVTTIRASNGASGVIRRLCRNRCHLIRAAFAGEPGVGRLGLAKAVAAMQRLRRAAICSAHCTMGSLGRVRIALHTPCTRAKRRSLTVHPATMQDANPLEGHRKHGHLVWAVGSLDFSTITPHGCSCSGANVDVWRIAYQVMTSSMPGAT
jgi:hypothetical protein